MKTLEHPGEHGIFKELCSRDSDFAGLRTSAVLCTNITVHKRQTQHVSIWSNFVIRTNFVRAQ